MQLSGFLTSVIRVFRWHRRWFAALLAAIAVLATVNAVSTNTSGAVAVVVATHRLNAGTVLGGDDLCVVWIPAGTVAEGAYRDPAELVGQEITAELPPRAPITLTNLRSHGSGVAAGNVALPVKFSDSDTTALLQVGSHIDILGSGAADGFSVVAGDIRVVAIPNADHGGVLSGGTGGLVLVEVDPSQAAAIAAAASAGALSFALR